jgi:hypothetical protein
MGGCSSTNLTEINQHLLIKNINNEMQEPAKNIEDNIKKLDHTSQQINNKTEWICMINDEELDEQSFDKIKSLVKNGIDVNLRGNEEKTILFTLVSSYAEGNIPAKKGLVMMQYLIDNGIDIHAVMHEDGDRKYKRLFGKQKKIKPKPINYREKNIMTHAIETDWGNHDDDDDDVWLKLIKILIDNGADLNTKPVKYGETLLRVLINSSDLEVEKEEECELLKYIISKCNVNQLDHQLYSPLMDVVGFSSYNLAKYLIDLGANLNIVNIHGCTVLDIAKNGKNYIHKNCYRSNEMTNEFIEYLIEKGAKNGGTIINSDDNTFYKEEECAVCYMKPPTIIYSCGHI